MSREPKWTDDQRQQIRDFRRIIPAKHNEAYRRTFDTALSGKSLRAACKAHCLDCMGWVMKEVRDCTVVSCSLWLYRPWGSPELRVKRLDKKPRSFKTALTGASPMLSSEPNAPLMVCGGRSK